MADYFTIAGSYFERLDVFECSSQTDFVDEDPSDGLEVMTYDGDCFELVQDPRNLGFYHWEGNNGKILSASFELQSPPQRVVVFDEDGDGDLDLFIADTFGVGYISINVGAETFASTSPQDLLNRLPPDMRTRIQALLERQFNSCEPLYSDDRDLQDQKSTTTNCFGTAFWVVSGDAAPNRESNIPGNMLINKLDSLGYRNTMSFRAFVESSNGETALALEDMAQNLTTGDVLIFKSPPLWDLCTTICQSLLENHHAALYLGRIDDNHFIFHKPSRPCGPGSPYEITTLQELFLDAFTASLYRTISVYRQ